jgi:hypothetical protein
VPLAARARTVLEQRLSPEGTRRPTLFERVTVRRLPWRWLVRLNAWLAALGKAATCVYCLVVGALIIGFDVRPTLQSLLRSEKPLEHVLALSIILITAIFLLARSLLGFGRWKLQRELWRRDVERLSA